MSLRTQVEARLVGFDRLDASSQAETLKQIEAQLMMRHHKGFLE